MKKSTLMVTLLIALLSSSLAYGPSNALASPDEPPPWSENGRGHRLDKMAEVLDLSAGQKAQIVIIRETQREKIAPLRQELDENREKLHELARTMPFDEEAVRALAASQADLRTDLIVSRARAKNAIFTVLTPEQRELAEKLRPAMKRRGPGGHHRTGAGM